MNRAVSRGSPAGHGSSADLLNMDSSTHSPANGKVIEERRIHGDSLSSPGALSLTLSQTIHNYLSPSRQNSDYGSINFFKSPMPSLSGSGQARNKRGYVSLGTTMLLCFVSAFMFITMLGSRSPVYSIRLVPKLGIYRSYRRLQAEVVVDPFRGGIFGQGTVRMKELPMCEGSVEDMVPCYVLSKHDSAGLVGDQGVDRHCQAQSNGKTCLIPPSDDYRIPLRWPMSSEGVWRGNMKFVEPYSLSGIRPTRLKLGSDDLVTLDLELSGLDGLDNHVQQIMQAITSKEDEHTELMTVLDINCGLSRLRSYHDMSDKASVMCLAPYATNGSQVHYALERGYPAMIGSPISRQLPFPSSSFDVIHALDFDVELSWKEGLVLLELDRVLKPGGLVVWTSQATSLSEQLGTIGKPEQEANKERASRLCWSATLEADQTVIWKKTTNESCFSSRSSEGRPGLCGKQADKDAAWYPHLRPCIMRPITDISSQAQKLRQQLLKAANGFSLEELLGDSIVWATTVRSYWSLLTPLIFSDHPKRPGEEDPPPPSNIVRNIMDMNAAHGGLNLALLEARKSVWVMNVVPRSGPDTLSSIYNHGLIGAEHDWCEAFPTYPRTYDLLHGIGLLSQEAARPNGCGLSTLFLEMDRILRPEGWVILRDREELIEDARIAAGQMRWESRVIEVEGLEDQQLLVCQKIFWKNPSAKTLL